MGPEKLLTLPQDETPAPAGPDDAAYDYAMGPED